MCKTLSLLAENLLYFDKLFLVKMLSSEAHSYDVIKSFSK